MMVLDGIVDSDHDRYSCYRIALAKSDASV